MIGSYGPGPYLFGGREGLEETIDKVISSEINHSRGLCGKPDNNQMTFEKAFSNPPKCLCCGHPMRPTDSLSSSFQRLGMFEVWCDFCLQDRGEK